MKKVLAVLAVVTMIGATSCKKDWTCDCDIIDIPIQNAKKADAQDVCDAASTTYGEDCELK